MSIRGKCNAEGKWPMVYAAAPCVGDWILGIVDDQESLRQVSKVVHSVDTAWDRALGRSYDVPLVLIELE